MVPDAPMFGAVKIGNNTFEVRVMKLGWTIGKLGKGGDSVSNVGTATCVCEHEFAKDSAIGETHRIFKGLMSRGTFFGAAQ